jgi:hypothetical protein
LDPFEIYAEGLIKKATLQQMKRAVVFTGLLLIVVANLMMMYYVPYWREGFQMNMNNANVMNSANSENSENSMNTMNSSNSGNSMNVRNTNNVREGFASRLESAGGAKGLYEPIGQYDGVKLSTGNSISEWRYTAPNEPLMGAEFTPGDDELFMFKNNQCKPECCGASFSCGGGCVCTTPQQRQYIAGRGGNRTEPEDSA